MSQGITEAEYIISHLTVENQVVLDPFLGGGTTAIAALKLNRKIIGTETREDVFNMAKNRIDEFLSSKNTHVPLTEEKSVFTVEDFFCDNPSLPYKPLPPHSLEESPCYPIIGINHERHTYYCKLHPKDSENVNLESVEKHCKHKEPELHENEIIKQLYFDENKIDEAIDKMLSAYQSNNGK
jgi:hypothetical protein